MKLSKIVSIILLILMLSTVFAGCSVNAENKYTSDSKIDDLANAKIAVLTGSVTADIVKKRLPNAQFSEYQSVTDALMAVINGKADVFPCDECLYTTMVRENQPIARLEEAVGESTYGFIFPKDKDPELQAEFNSFLAEIKADGTLDALEEKWFSETESPTEFLTYDHLSGEKITLGLCSSQKPFVYMKDAKYTGFDIEILIKFAEKNGYYYEFEDAAFSSVLTGVSTGSYDIGSAGFTITAERAESVDFSDVYHAEDFCMVIRSDKAPMKLTDFENAKLGAAKGSLYIDYTKNIFPNAKLDIYNTFSDLFQCVKMGKIDGFLLDEPNYNAVKRSDGKLNAISVPQYDVEIGYGFQKNEGGDRLAAEMNEFISKLTSDGTKDALLDKWYGSEEPEKTLTAPDFSDNTKEIKVAMDATRKPFVYMLNNEYAGFETEVFYMFCEEYDYKPTIENIIFTEGLAGLQSGRYDVVGGGLYMTAERKESVNFSEPYMIADVVMVTYEGSDDTDFFTAFVEGFDKTFIRESRWKLILEGVFTTLIISIFSVLGGTALGFGLYMLARSANKIISQIARGFAKVYGKLIAGTPTLVILMVLFYVVFGSADISGVLVAIIGFILIFGAFVYEQLTLTVNSIDRGQTEAAYALGYSRNGTFFRIILPQAMKLFVPTYSGEIISLIKATSVVGYIAVNDLTKMGDIIRGSTYEAFFPLISVAVIYFGITWIFAALLGIIKKKTEPKLRKKENLLKGVIR